MASFVLKSTYSNKSKKKKNPPQALDHKKQKGLKRFLKTQMHEHQKLFKSMYTIVLYMKLFLLLPLIALLEARSVVIFRH